MNRVETHCQTGRCDLPQAQHSIKNSTHRKAQHDHEPSMGWVICRYFFTNPSSIAISVLPTSQDKARRQNTSWKVTWRWACVIGSCIVLPLSLCPMSFRNHTYLEMALSGRNHIAVENFKILDSRLALQGSRMVWFPASQQQLMISNCCEVWCAWWGEAVSKPCLLQSVFPDSCFDSLCNFFIHLGMNLALQLKCP